MTEQLWKALAGNVRRWDLLAEFQIEFLRGKGLRPEHWLLDIGCGPLRGGLPLIEYLDAGHYIGVDVRPEAVEAGKERIREAGLEEKEPVLIEGDMTAIDLGVPFDYVLAYAVLLHLDDRQVVAMLDVVSAHLAEGGRFYASVLAGNYGNRGNWQGFPLMRRQLRTYGMWFADAGLTMRDAGPIPALPGERMLEAVRMEREEGD